MTDLTLLSRLSTTIATVPDQTTLLRTIIAELPPTFGFYGINLMTVHEKYVGLVYICFSYLLF